MSRIFISYRREDTLVYADRLQEELGEHFGPDEVFRDLDAIAPGIDFVTAIDRALDQSEIMLVLIGPDWLSPDARRRLHERGDYVRVEIAAGLRKPTIRVIPVLLRGAHMPKTTDLPEDVRPLSRRNAFEMIDTRWRADRAELMRQLDRVLSGEAAGRRGLRRWVADRLRRVPAAAWAVAAVLALAAAVLVSVVLLRSPGPAQSSDPELTPPPNGETTPDQTGTEASPSPGALVWSIPPTFDLGEVGNQGMNAVVNPLKGPVPSFVAVGFAETPEGRDAAVWTSTSGGEWERAPDIAAGGDQVMNGVTYVSRSELLVAGGTTEAEGELDAAMWTSKNGRRWTPVEGLSSSGTDEAITSVNGTTLGLTAAGWETGNGEDGAIWLVPSGGAPSKAPISELGGDGNQRVARVLDLRDDDGFVAVGFDNGNAGVWFSEDGAEWRRVNSPALAGPGDQEILDGAVSFQSGAVIAVGRDGENGAVWTSITGKVWKRAPDLDGAFAASSEGPVEVLRVVFAEEAAQAAGAPLVIAGGRAGSAAAVWTSARGRKWDRALDSSGDLAGSRDAAIEGLTAKDSVIAVGWSDGGDGPTPAVWHGMPPE